MILRRNAKRMLSGMILHTRSCVAVVLCICLHTCACHLALLNTWVLVILVGVAVLVRKVRAVSLIVVLLIPVVAPPAFLAIERLVRPVAAQFMFVIVLVVILVVLGQVALVVLEVMVPLAVELVVRTGTAGAFLNAGAFLVRTGTAGAFLNAGVRTHDVHASFRNGDSRRACKFQV